LIHRSSAADRTTTPLFLVSEPEALTGLISTTTDGANQYSGKGSHIQDLSSEVLLNWNLLKSFLHDTHQVRVFFCTR